jgi:hypothetical protein
MDIKKLTRAKAERLVARTDRMRPTDYDLLRLLETHPNKHVVQKVRFKLLEPSDRATATASKYVGAGLSALSTVEVKS